MKAILLALVGLAFSTHAWTTKAESSLLTFCLAKAPDDSETAAFHKERCRSILEQAAEEDANRAVADVAKAKADLEKAQLDNLAKAFPAQTPAADKAAVDIKGFVHFAQFRQASLLAMLGQTISDDINAKYGTLKPEQVLLLNPSEVASLRKNTLPVDTLLEELNYYTTGVDNAFTTCNPPGQANSVGYATQSLGGIIPWDAALGFSLKLSQAFQTNLSSTEPAAFGAGAHSVLAAGLVSQWNKSDIPLYIGLPSIKEDNEVVKALATLKTSAQKLLGAIEKLDKEGECYTDSKALIEGIQARLVELNKSADPAIASPMLTVMQLAELKVDPKSSKETWPQILVLDALHSGGSISASKTSFTSQRTTAIATVVAAYRLESVQGRIIQSAIFTCPGTQSELDVARYTKDFKGDPKKKYDGTCTPAAAKAQ